VTEKRSEGRGSEMSNETKLTWAQESYVLAAIMESLIAQDAPDSVSGYKIMDAVRKVFREKPWAESGERTNG